MERLPSANKENGVCLPRSAPEESCEKFSGAKIGRARRKRQQKGQQHRRPRERNGQPLPAEVAPVLRGGVPLPGKPGGIRSLL